MQIPVVITISPASASLRSLWKRPVEGGVYQSVMSRIFRIHVAIISYRKSPLAESSSWLRFISVI